MIEFRRITNCDVSATSKMLTETFENYPTFTALFNKKFRSSRRYKRLLNNYFKLELKVYLKHGLVMAGFDGDRIVSIALLENTSEKQISLWNYFKNGGWRFVPIFFSHGKSLMRGFNIKYDNQLLNKKNAYLLDYLAVDKDYQNQGIGKKMLTSFLIPEIHKLGGKRLVLFTNTKRDVDFYRKNNFEITSLNLLHLKYNDVRNWLLTKEIFVI